MTTGEVIFYSGLGLLGVTALLAILFWLKKPQYIPENAAYEERSPGTQKLRNGYPTDRLTIRKDASVPVETVSIPILEETPLLAQGTTQIDETVSINGTASNVGQDTVVLQEGTEILETVSLGE